MNFLEARLKVLAALDEAIDIFNDVNLRETIDNPDLDRTFSDLELDSLSAVQCCLTLEDDLNIDIDPADLAIHDSINKLAKHIAERTSAT